MGGAMLCVTVVVLGISSGWQPLPDGGMEYIVQLEPQAVERLQAGDEVRSDIPASLRDLRSFRIVFGDAVLPRRAPAEAIAGPAFPDLPGRPRASHVFLDTLFPRYHPVKFKAPVAEAEPPTVDKVAALPAPPAAALLAVPQPGPDAETTLPAAETSKSDEPPGGPPVSWTVTVMGFMVAFGGMIYFGWIAWDYRVRYRTLLRRFLDSTHDSPSPLAPG